MKVNNNKSTLIGICLGSAFCASFYQTGFCDNSSNKKVEGKVANQANNVTKIKKFDSKSVAKNKDYNKNTTSNSSSLEKRSNIQLQNPSINDENTLKVDLYNIDPIYVLNSVRAWVEMHLEEIHNAPFFTDGCEISRHIIDGVEKGLIQPYADDDFKTPMSKEDFLKNLRDPASLSNFSDDDISKQKNHNFDAIPDIADRFLPRQVSIIRLKIDFIIDTLRSMTHTRIMSMSIVIPSKYFQSGVERVVAHFDFRELMKFFSTIDANSSWIDSKNFSNNKKFSEVFEQKRYWFEQSYLLYTAEDKVKKLDSSNLNLNKIKLLENNDYFLYFD